MSKRILYYVKPVMALDSKRRYLRLTDEEAKVEYEKDMYRNDSKECKSIVKVDVHSPGYTDYLVIFVEHPSVQNKTASDIFEDWIEWWEEVVWNAGFDDLRFDYYIRVDH